jgi:predicted secreted protein
MAQPVTARGTRLHILQGNGADPELFAAYCGITANNFSFKTQTNDIYVPDCASPEDPAWRAVIKSGRSLSISGNGLLDVQVSLVAYLAAYNEDASKNYQIEIDLPLANGGGYWTCAMQLTQLDITGSQNDLATAAITLESDGPVTWNPAAA